MRMSNWCIQVWDGYGVQPDFNLTCVLVHGRISRQWAYNLQSSFKWRTLPIALIQLFPNDCYRQQKHASKNGRLEFVGIQLAQESFIYQWSAST